MRMVRRPPLQRTLLQNLAGSSSAPLPNLGGFRRRAFVVLAQPPSGGRTGIMNPARRFDRAPGLRASVNTNEKGGHQFRSCLNSRKHYFGVAALPAWWGGHPTTSNQSHSR